MPQTLDRDPTQRARYQALRGKLLSDRSSFDSHWQELGSWLLPRRIRFSASDRNKGDKRNQNIINSTGTFSVRTLQAGFLTNMTNSALPWMTLTTPDPDMAKQPDVKAWLHDVSKRMLAVFEQTNLYTALGTMYGDLACFGTAAMAVVEDEDVFRCYPYAIGSYALGMDARGKATTFVRDYELTVRQVVEQFGRKPNSRDIDWSTISQTVKDLWHRGSYEEPVSVCWMVLPNEQARKDRLEAKYLPWSSCHFEVGSENKPFLRESGFRTFPILAPRWETTGEDSYGTNSCGMVAMGDVKGLQVMEREGAKAIQKAVSPPILMPMNASASTVSMLPGGVTYADVRDSHGGRALHEITLNIGHLELKLEKVEYRIKEAFFVPLFQMLAQRDQYGSQQPITAREVEERHAEKLFVGPVLDRIDDELLGPLVDRGYEIMDVAGLIPEAPAVLEGIKLRVKFSSVMHEAQKRVGASGQDRLLQTVIPLIEAGIVSRHKVNGNQVIDNYSEMFGGDPRLIRSNDEAGELDAADAEAARGAQAAEMAKNVLPAVAAAGAAPIAPDSALDRLAAGMGQ